MKTFSTALLAFTLSLASAAAMAQTPPASAPVSADDVWARATVPGQTSTGAFMTLRTSADATLTGATSPAAGKVEVHEMKMDGDVMRMRQVPELTLSADKPTALTPGGYHIMLMNLTQQAKAGNAIPLTLTYRTTDGQSHQLEVSATVRALNAGNTPHQHGSAH